jgi:hypothetical protein
MTLASSNSGKCAGRRLSKGEGPDLEIASAIFDDDALKRLIDEWLVPTMVDQYIRERFGASKNDHNGNLPL